VKKILNFIILLTISSLVSISSAKDNIEYVDILGVQVKFNDDNSFKSLKSTAEHDLVFTDRSSIRQALSIATMSAKAELSKWMEEKIVSEEGFDEVATQIAKRQTDGKSQSVEATKEDVQTYLRNLSNSSSTVLTGVTVIDQIIDRDKKYVSVTVGVSSKYMAAAAKMRTETAKNIAKGREAEANRNNSSHFESDNGQNPTTSQPSTEQVDSGRTHRRSPAFNDF